ncbi:MAG: HTTM domain-containing protein [Kofleriaceae bacterium]
MIRRAWDTWVALWDRREPPTQLALVRILLASVFLVDYLDVARDGLVTAIWTKPPTGFAMGDAWISGPTAHLIGIVALVAIILGIATRPACVIFALASAQLSHLTPNGESGLDDLARITFVILAFSQCNARWSIDALIFKSLRKTDVPAWPRYLLLFQLVWVYFNGGINKSAGAWGPQGGFTALANALSDPHAARFGPGFAGALYPLTRIATALTMAFELGAPLFLLAYFKEWRARYIWIALGVGFEVGIAVGLRLGSFPYGMLALFPVLFYPRDFQARTPANRASSPS